MGNRIKRKLGRNDLCLCGSGKKFKHCCLTIPLEKRKFKISLEVAKELKSKMSCEEKKKKSFTANYGAFRQPMICDSPNGRIAVIGSKLFKVSKEESFHKVLIDNLMRLIGYEWFQKEVQIVNNKNPLINWFQSYKTNNRYYLKIINLAFDLYIIEDNAELQEKLISKLRVNDQFEGARFELLCTAICIRSGLEIIKFYDEARGISCAEFVARDPDTGYCFDLEAKRSRAKRINYGSLINRALEKLSDSALVIFIDLNTTTEKADYIISNENQIKQILGPIKRDENEKDLYSLVVLVNDPYEVKEMEYPSEGCAILPDNPKFKPFPTTTFEKIKKGLYHVRDIPNDFEQSEL